MRLVVQKFGGTSVATAERIMAAARRAIRAQQQGNRVIVVVSARGDTTDELIALAKEITDNPPSREMDMLLSTGEQISIALMAMAIQALGYPAISFTGAQIGIVTDSFHTKARIKNISTQRILQALNDGQIVIVAGFQGVDENYNITTLGRGGSDTTAVALAAVMKHDPASPFREVDCEIYTDVDGVYTTDPRIVPEAQKIAAISYDEMLELASLGAGVMHSRSIEFAKKFNVPVMVRSSFSDVEGTWIMPETDWMTQVPVCGAAIAKEEARVSIVGVPDVPGVSHRIFSAIADSNIAVDMICQNLGVAGRAEVGFTVLRNELPATLAVIRRLADEFGAEVRYEDNVSKVSIVGAGMRTHTGVAERFFRALADADIQVKAVTTGDIKISALVDKADGPRALRAVHQAFGLHLPRRDLPSRALTGGDGHADPRELLASELPVTGRLEAMEDIVVSDITLDESQGRVTLLELPSQTRVLSELFAAIAQAGINVDLIVHSLRNGTARAEVSFSVPRADVRRAWEIAQSLARTHWPQAQLLLEPEIAVVSVTGVGVRTHTGVARRMFGALASRGINIAMISTSEIRIEVVVDARHGSEALAALRQAFCAT
ncbi:MAG: aspartate kinase [Gemmatales bacterium]|nr:aspartate kinase [Gemmatales bacterium]